jgi:hypothetical protein
MRLSIFGRVSTNHVNICRCVTHSSDLLATTMAFGMSKGNLKMVGEVVVVCWCELIKEFF